MRSSAGLPATGRDDTRTPPRDSISPAKKFARNVCTFVARSVPLKAITRGPPPGPAPVIRSSRPSPFKSPTLTNAPFRNVSSNAKKSLKTFVGVPLTRDRPSKPAMRGAPPIPAATIKSMRPSALRSPAAMRAPPRKFSSSMPKKSAITRSKSPRRNTRTRGPPPSSGETMRSATPSPSMSPVATNIPPVKVDSNTNEEPRTAPVLPS